MIELADGGWHPRGLILAGCFLGLVFLQLSSLALALRAPWPSSTRRDREASSKYRLHIPSVPGSGTCSLLWDAWDEDVDSTTLCARPGGEKEEQGRVRPWSLWRLESKGGPLRENPCAFRAAHLTPISFLKGLLPWTWTRQTRTVCNVTLLFPSFSLFFPSFFSLPRLFPALLACARRSCDRHCPEVLLQSFQDSRTLRPDSGLPRSIRHGHSLLMS